jgi:hypothetical protein
MEFSLRRYPSGLSSLGIYLRFPHLFDLMCVEIADARMPSFHDLASCLCVADPWNARSFKIVAVLGVASSYEIDGALAF